ncbi:MAG: hypothetical protein D6714_04120, partial [Bacteroidetes bacterium]
MIFVNARGRSTFFLPICHCIWVFLYLCNLFRNPESEKKHGQVHRTNFRNQTDSNFLIMYNDNPTLEGIKKIDESK